MLRAPPFYFILFVDFVCEPALEEETGEKESARGRPMMSGKADCNGRQSGRTMFLGLPFDGVDG